MNAADHAEAIRQQADRVMALRHWMIRLEANAGGALASVAGRLESELLSIEDALTREADAIRPPAFHPTGQQWLAGLCVRAGQ